MKPEFENRCADCGKRVPSGATGYFELGKRDRFELRCKDCSIIAIPA